MKINTTNLLYIHVQYVAICAILRMPKCANTQKCQNFNIQYLYQTFVVLVVAITVRLSWHSLTKNRVRFRNPCTRCTVMNGLINISMTALQQQ
jgi:hypothetical protein